MTRVQVVCSVHREIGRATARELHWLLCRLQPEVLFLEESATGLAAFVDGSRGTLESAAVGKYRSEHAVELVPVDISFHAADFEQKATAMFEWIERLSEKYCQLEGANRHHTARGGFAYLNSPLCAHLQSETQKEIKATVEAARTPALTEVFGLWTNTMEMREGAMVDSVEAYAARASSQKGLLLVGAAHRQPLLERSLRRRENDASRVSWDFDWHRDSSFLVGNTPTGTG